jgi:hypothetical protein
MRDKYKMLRLACCMLAFVLMVRAQSTEQYRNLGKAFYENPTTQSGLLRSSAWRWPWRRYCFAILGVAISGT